MSQAGAGGGGSPGGTQGRAGGRGAHSSSTAHAEEGQQRGRPRREGPQCAVHSQPGQGCRQPTGGAAASGQQGGGTPGMRRPRQPHPGGHSAAGHGRPAERACGPALGARRGPLAGGVRMAHLRGVLCGVRCRVLLVPLARVGPSGQPAGEGAPRHEVSGHGSSGGGWLRGREGGGRRPAHGGAGSTARGGSTQLSRRECTARSIGEQAHRAVKPRERGPGGAAAQQWAPQECVQVRECRSAQCSKAYRAGEQSDAPKQGGEDIGMRAHPLAGAPA